MSRILDEEGKPADWATSLAIPIFKGIGDIMNCGMHIDVIFLEHSVKIAETVSEKRLKRIAMIDDIQFSLMSGNGTSDAKFILRKITEEELAKNKK